MRQPVSVSSTVRKQREECYPWPSLQSGPGPWNGVPHLECILLPPDLSGTPEACLTGGFGSSQVTILAVTWGSVFCRLLAAGALVCCLQGIFSMVACFVLLSKPSRRRPEGMKGEGRCHRIPGLTCVLRGWEWNPGPEHAKHTFSTSPHP